MASHSEIKFGAQDFNQSNLAYPQNKNYFGSASNFLINEQSDNDVISERNQTMNQEPRRQFDIYEHG